MNSVFERPSVDNILCGDVMWSIEMFQNWSRPLLDYTLDELANKEFPECSRDYSKKSPAFIKYANYFLDQEMEQYWQGNVFHEGIVDRIEGEILNACVGDNE